MTNQEADYEHAHALDFFRGIAFALAAGALILFAVFA